MAETFKNYLKVVNRVNSEYIIIPPAISGRNEQPFKDGTNNYNFRDENSNECQVHSLYISQIDTNRINGSERYNPKNFKSIDLYIKDTKYPEVQLYIAYDIRIVPGSPFYIEKNITLEKSQYLCAYSSNLSKDIDINNNNTLTSINNNINLHISASTILFSDDIDY